MERKNLVKFLVLLIICISLIYRIQYTIVHDQYHENIISNWNQEDKSNSLTSLSEFNDIIRGNSGNYPVIIRHEPKIFAGTQSPSTSTTKPLSKLEKKRILSNYILTEDQVATTSHFLSRNDFQCTGANGTNLDLLVIVPSSVANFKDREAIRRTWGNFSLYPKIKILFLVGISNPDNDQSISYQEKLDQEDNLHSDILQVFFIDAYENLTLKTISMLHYVNYSCPNIKYILKIDDDVFLNVKAVSRWINSHNYTKSIIGKVGHNWAPHRSPKSKWYIPREVYDKPYYPDFTTGPAYLITRDAIADLLDACMKITPIYLEDVFVTGIAAELAKVTRVHDNKIVRFHIPMREMATESLIASHDHPIEEFSKYQKYFDSISN